jgi:DNA-binding FadR family transcriptional regulator
VSLVTVREALKGLETFGLIEKRKGKGGGIFVAEPRSEYVKTTLFHFLNHKKFTSRDLSELRMIIEPVACKRPRSAYRTRRYPGLKETSSTANP